MQLDWFLAAVHQTCVRGAFFEVFERLALVLRSLLGSNGNSREQTFESRSCWVRTGSFQRASVSCAFDWRSNESSQKGRVRVVFKLAFERDCDLNAFLACKTLVFTLPINITLSHHSPIVETYFP